MPSSDQDPWYTTSASGTPTASGSEESLPSPRAQAGTKRFEPWRLVDKDEKKLPFKNALPKFEGNVWAETLKGLSEQDNARCKAWTDEVQNLLIFAGLFSAVVTAFVVESYKSLQQDPNEISSQLLFRIATQLEGGANTTSNLPPLVHVATSNFSPSSSDIRVNALWFLSLILGLTTALVGIVCSQWLREHQLPTQALNPDALELSLHHMYAEALDRWYVPQIFAALPVLLQVGLVLFFVGLIDFLWHLNHVVATPVLSSVGLTLLFLLTTTCLPALQELTLYSAARSPSQPVRSPCPYRSPQSWAFLKMVLPLWRMARSIFMIICLRLTKYDRRYQPEHLVHPNNHENFRTWLTLGEGWLSLRTIDAIMASTPKLDQYPDYRFLRRLCIPPYDCSLALAKSISTTRWLPAFHSILEVFRMWAEDLDRVSQYLANDLLTSREDDSFYGFHNWVSNELKAPPSVKEESDQLFALSLIYFRSDTGPLCREIAVRITGWLVSEDRRITKNSYPFEGILSMPLSTSLPEISSQMTHLLLEFFHFASQFNPAEDDIGHTTHTTSLVIDLIQAAVPSLRRDLRVFEDEVQKTLRLKFPPQGDWDDASQQGSRDYLFIMFSSYLYLNLAEGNPTRQRSLIRTTLEPYRRHIERRNKQEGQYFLKLAECTNTTDWLVRVWEFPDISVDSVEDDSYYDRGASPSRSPSYLDDVPLSTLSKIKKAGRRWLELGKATVSRRNQWDLSERGKGGKDPVTNGSEAATSGGRHSAETEQVVGQNDVQSAEEENNTGPSRGEAHSSVEVSQARGRIIAEKGVGEILEEDSAPPPDARSVLAEMEDSADSVLGVPLEEVIVEERRSSR